MSDPPPTVLIRDAVLADRPTIVEFNRCLALETEGKVLDPAVLDAGVRTALADPDRLRYWVAEIGSPAQLVGQAAITPRMELTGATAGSGGSRASMLPARIAAAACFALSFSTSASEAHGRPRSDRSSALCRRLQSARQCKRIESLGMKPGGYSVYEELWLERCLGSKPIDDPPT